MNKEDIRDLNPEEKLLLTRFAVEHSGKGVPQVSYESGFYVKDTSIKARDSLVKVIDKHSTCQCSTAFRNAIDFSACMVDISGNFFI